MNSRKREARSSRFFRSYFVIKLLRALLIISCANKRNGVNMINIKGAIFDLDGTLLDSMHIWDTIAEDYLLSQGILPDSNLREAVRVMSIQQVCEHFCNVYGLPLTQQEIADGINKMIEDFYFNHAQLKDGAVEMLERLKNHGTRMCVATATDRYLVEAALNRTGIADYFGRIFTCTESGAGKDQPDIFDQALDFLGTAKNETIIFEDSLYAIKTAKAHGFIVAAFYDAVSHHQQKEIKSLADYYYRSLTEWTASND